MKKFLMVALITAVAALGYYLSGLGGGTSKDYFEVSGVIECDDAGVGSKEGGRVAEVPAAEGESVEAGQALIRLESDSLTAMLMEAVSGADMARAGLEMLRRGYTVEEIEAAREAVRALRSQTDLLERGTRSEQIEAARAELRAAESQADNLRLTHERLANLFDAGLVSRQQVDNARTAMEGAANRLDATAANYEMALNGPRDEEKESAAHRLKEAEAKLKRMELGPRNEEISKAEAALEQAEARVRLLQSRMEEMTIRAPAKGTVDVLDLRPGDIVAPGEEVAKLVFDSSLWVRVFIPENRLGAVSRNQKLKLHVDSLPGKLFTGRLSRISERAEFTPRNIQTPHGRASQVFRARIDIEDPEKVLRAGMTAITQIPLSEWERK